jgi:heme/copper-type cytochrome/quinol oxidase subunit 4
MHQFLHRIGSFRQRNPFPCRSRFQFSAKGRNWYAAVSLRITMVLGRLALWVLRSSHLCTKLTFKIIGLCFITGACCIFAQLLLCIWLQESRVSRISLTILAAFFVMPLTTFALAPFKNILRSGGRDQISNTTFRSDVEAVPRTPSSESPLSSIHPFSSVYSTGRYPFHHSSGLPP